MKLIIPCIICCVAVFLSGCNLKNEAKVKFTTTLTLEDPFVVDVNTEDPDNNPYTNSGIIDAMSDPDIDTYASQITSIKLDKITYRITNFNAPGTVVLNSGLFSIGAIGEAPVVVAEETNLTLANSTSDMELNISTDGLNDISDVLLAERQAEISTSATISDSPVEFRVQITFHVTVSINPNL